MSADVSTVFPMSVSVPVINNVAKLTSAPYVLLLLLALLLPLAVLLRSDGVR